MDKITARLGIGALAVVGVAFASSLNGASASGPSEIWAVLGAKPGGGEAPFEVKSGQHTTGVSYDINNIFTVTFDRDVSKCGYQVTPRGPRGAENYSANARPADGAPKSITVTMSESTTGNWHRPSFQVFVTC